MEQVTRDRLVNFADSVANAGVVAGGVAGFVASLAAIAVLTGVLTGVVAGAAFAAFAAAGVVGAGVAVATVGAGVAGFAAAGDAGRVNIKTHRKSHILGRIFGFGVPLAASVTTGLYAHHALSTRPVEAAKPAPVTRSISIELNGAACGAYKVTRTPDGASVIMLPKGCNLKLP